MQKKVIGLLLTLSLLLGCFTALPAFAADQPEAQPDANAYLAQNGDNDFTVTSLDGTVAFHLYLNASGNLCYTVAKSDVNWIEESALGVIVDNTTYGQDAAISGAEMDITNRTYAYLGNTSEITDHGVTATFSLSQEDLSFSLELRVYDNGVAFRYILPGEGTRTVKQELTQFILPERTARCWYGINNSSYESTQSSYSPITGVNEKYNPDTNSGCESQYIGGNVTDHINAPMTGEFADGAGYVAIMEGAVTDGYNATNLRWTGAYTYQVSNTWTSGQADVRYTTAGDLSTGWRLISVAETLNELVNNYNVQNVAPEADQTLYGDTSWIQPGRAAWSWLNDFHAGRDADLEEYIQYTLGAAKLGYEYNIVDEGYSTWGADYTEQLKYLSQLGQQYNVNQVLWAAYGSGYKGFSGIQSTAKADEFVSFLKEIGFAGGKVDFWPDECNSVTIPLQNYLLTAAARKQLLINLHGASDTAGNNATYPNEISREGIRGCETCVNDDLNYNWQTQFLTIQPFTRFLSGHADWTPGANNAMQYAELIIIDSPMQSVATSPETILASEACEFIKSIPTVWDQTVVLSNSKIGSLTVYAKEHQGTWFLGGISDETQEDIVIDLSEFLGNGTYQMELWADTTTTQKTKTVKTVTKDDTITISGMQQKLGFAARFTQLEMSQYGGEIKAGQPLTLTASDENAVVKYTTDGTDPLTSETAVTYSEPIQLTRSCRLQAAIVSGEGAGTVQSYQFNRVDTINYTVENGEEQSTVTLTANFDGTLLYTIDGTDPTYEIIQDTLEQPGQKIGDLNSDDTISVTDVVLLRKAILNNTFSAAGDLNQDSNLSVTDVVLLRKAILNNQDLGALPGSSESIYYIQPTGNTKIYEGPFAVTEDCTINVLGVPADDADPITISFNVKLLSPALTPDVYLGTDYVEATTGWSGDPASVDQNTKGNTISIAGIQYAHGISTNSVGKFVYNVPTDATQFVGVAGVDDCTYSNTGDGYKASITCSISFDGSETITTPILHQGEFYNIVVDVPAGAKQITITFGDGGDGITCDNASLGNAGWILSVSAD